MEPQIGFCTNPDGARIAYATLGQGPTIVIPPGYYENITAYKTFPEVRYIFDNLARYHTLVFYDQHGAGLSDRNRTVFTLESELSDLETVVDYLKLDRMILDGVASSGPIVIAYAAKYPERVTHLILYGTFAYYGKFVKEEIQSSLVSLISQHNNWLGGRALVSLLGTQIDMKYLESFVGHMNHVITPEMASHQLEMAYKLDVAHLCPLVKAPTLVMHRKGDKYIVFKAGLELASLIPNARFVPLEGDIHINILGDTKSYLNYVLEFLGDPIISDPMPNDSAYYIGKVMSSSNIVQPKPEQKKKEWPHLITPLVDFIIILLASVIAGIILMLIKC